MDNNVIYETIITVLNKLFGPTDLIKYTEGIFNLFLSTINQVINLSPYTTEYGIKKNVWNGLSSALSSPVQVAAQSLLLLLWLIGFLRSSAEWDSAGQNPGFRVGAIVARLFIPSAFIANYKFLVDIILGLGYKITNSISSSTLASVDWVKSFDLGNTNWMAAGSLSMGLVWLVAVCFCGYALVIGFKILFTVIGRMLKMYAVILLAPIAFACYGSKYTEHLPKKYLESVLKIVIQGLIIIIDIILYSAITSGKSPIIVQLFGSTDINKLPSPLPAFLIQSLNIFLLYAMITGSETLSERIL